MGYKITYEKKADVLTIVLKKSLLSHTEEMGDFIVHVDQDDQLLFLGDT
jgi:uncharacterized protein YuzE